MRRAAFALTAALMAGSAVAQDAAPTGEDWDLVKDDKQKATIAYVTTTAGVVIATRCKDGGFSALLTGLPEASRRTKVRQLHMTFRDEEGSRWGWNVTTDRTAVVADFPAPFARELRKGGRLQIVVPDGAGPGRNLRYDLTLPPSGAAIDETLNACGRPLTDPRDLELEAIGEDGLQLDMRWARQITPSYPFRTRYAEGFVVTTCVAEPDGRLRDCVIETEHPGDGNFGAEVMRVVGDARVASNGDTQPVLPRMVAFRITFKMQE